MEIRHRLAIAGDSAGGHLALVTTFAAQGCQRPLPKALLLLYPMLDACESQSYRDLGDDYLITGTCSQAVSRLPGQPAPSHPEASPLHHPALSGLPPITYRHGGI